MKIPIFKLDFDDNFIKEYQDKCFDIFRSNRSLSECYYTKKFEDKFKQLVNSKYSCSVTSGTAAIDLALRALEVKGKVIVPINTFFATSVAVESAGCEVEFIDIEPNTFSIDPLLLEDKLKTQSIGAVIIVHIGGIISDYMHEIKRICNKYNVPLIEDAAHAHLSSRNDQWAGTIGDIGCFSFFPTKVMTTGEGGMVTTNNETIFKRMKSLKNFGRDLENGGICLTKNGVNYKINEFTGALGLQECERIEGRVDKRNKLVNRYLKNLKNTEYEPIIQKTGYCSYYKFITMIPKNIEREWLRDYCKQAGITLTGEVYKIPLHHQPVYSNFKNNSYPVAEYICFNHICPPLYPELTLEEVDYICEILIKAREDYEK